MPLNEATKAAWANPNDKPMEDYAKKKAARLDVLPALKAGAGHPLCVRRTMSWDRRSSSGMTPPRAKPWPVARGGWQRADLFAMDAGRLGLDAQRFAARSPGGLGGGFAGRVARTTPNRWLVRFGEAWTELFRNIPLLVQVFLWYHVLPVLVPVLQGVPPSVLVILALGLLHQRAWPNRSGGHPDLAARASAMPARRWASRCPDLPLRAAADGLPHRHPAADQRVMNIVQNSSVALRSASRSSLSLRSRRRRRPRAGIEIFIRGDAAVLRLGLRDQPHREVHRGAGPHPRHGGGPSDAEPRLQLPELGRHPSQLCGQGILVLDPAHPVAMLGGIVLGTLLAMMRLSVGPGWRRRRPSMWTPCAPSRW